MDYQDEKEHKIERIGKDRIVRLRRPRLERSEREGQGPEPEAGEIALEILSRVRPELLTSLRIVHPVGRAPRR